jgi:hypothetical protein
MIFSCMIFVGCTEKNTVEPGRVFYPEDGKEIGHNNIIVKNFITNINVNIITNHNNIINIVTNVINNVINPASNKACAPSVPNSVANSYTTFVDHSVPARFVDHSPQYYCDEPVYVQPVQRRYVDHSYGYCYDVRPIFSIGFGWSVGDCYSSSYPYRHRRFVDHSRSYSRPSVVHPPRVETRGTTSRFVDHSTSRSSSSPPSVRTR